VYSEDALIARIRERFFRPDDEVGLGDDAAVVAVPSGYSAVLCSDLLVEDVHFKMDTHPSFSVGYKSVAVNVSDVAAMGGVARHFLVSLAIPLRIDEAWVARFFDGIE
jgi:thiamine-monophosphate kinase